MTTARRKKKMAKSNTPPRYQYYTFLIYPDSTVNDFIERLREWHVPMYISPLHDKDTDEDGETKKPHYHVMVLFDTLKPLTACDEIIKSVNGVKPPLDTFIVKSKRAYARYLLHLDDPAKYPYYKTEKVTEICGADPYDEIIKSKSQQDFEQNEIIEAIQDYMEDHNIFNYAAIVRLARKSKNLEWSQCLKVNAYYFYSWCKSHNDPDWINQQRIVDEILERNYKL